MKFRMDHPPPEDKNHLFRSVVLFAGALRDGVVYSAWFNNSEFIKENIDEAIFMFALFKCRKSDKGRN